MDRHPLARERRGGVRRLGLRQRGGGDRPVERKCRRLPGDGRDRRQRDQRQRRARRAPLRLDERRGLQPDRHDGRGHGGPRQRRRRRAHRGRCGAEPRGARGPGDGHRILRCSRGAVAGAVVDRNPRPHRRAVPHHRLDVVERRVERPALRGAALRRVRGGRIRDQLSRRHGHHDERLRPRRPRQRQRAARRHVRASQRLDPLRILVPRQSGDDGDRRHESRQLHDDHERLGVQLPAQHDGRLGRGELHRHHLGDRDRSGVHLRPRLAAVHAHRLSGIDQQHRLRHLGERRRHLHDRRRLLAGAGEQRRRPAPSARHGVAHRLRPGVGPVLQSPRVQLRGAAE